jgi:tetratricopeptide (TPR) repeat protein/S1-C subfamily serine protease
MKKIAILLSTVLLSQASFNSAQAQPDNSVTSTHRIAQTNDDEFTLSPQQVQQTAKNITVRITSGNNGGSGVLIAQKGNTYLILTNAHVTRRTTQFQIQAPDGQKYTAKPIDGGFDPKYDLALLQFTSKTKYTLADLSDVGSPLSPGRTIYSAGFPFDAKEIGITSGQVSQLSDIPFDNGTQIGYTVTKGKGIRQGMSGGAIIDERGRFLGINTIGAAPISPNYTYHDGSKPPAKLATKYRQANWGIPVYNFLTNVKADILYGYDNLPKIKHQVTPTGYLAKLNNRARQMTVRIENSGGSGSGVIIATEGNSYYVLTAKHVIQDEKYHTHQKFTNHQIITYDQDRHPVTNTVVAQGVDMAVVKFSSNSNYPLARLGEYSPNSNEFVFVGGFPGRAKINSPLWQWQLNSGVINEREQGKLQAQTNLSFSNGYDLIYSSVSYEGMSGGPVFDTQGNVIGIHGRAEGADLNSLGISTQTFIGLLDKLRVNPRILKLVKTNPAELNSQQRNQIIATMQNIPQPQLEDSGERWLAYGNQLYRTFQLDKAIVAFDRAIAKNQKLAGNYGKALSLVGAGKYKLAESAISQSIAAVPPQQDGEYYYIWKYRSVILAASDKYDEALKAIDIAIGFQRGSAKGLEQNDLTLLNEKAAILSNRKQYPAAIAIHDEIVRKQPQAYTYNNRGNAKSDLGNHQAAIVDYDRAIALNPKYTQAYSNRGAAKSALGNHQAAIIDLDRAIALNPKFTYAYNNRGLAKSDLGNKQEAIIDYDRAIALESKFSQAYSNRGAAKSALGNHQAAIADLDRAIAIDPKFANAYNNRGLAKFNMGNKQAAIVDYDRAIAIDPKYAIPYYNRGVAKYELGNKQAAISDFDRAIAIDPKYANAYNNRGLAKSDLGDLQSAIIDLDRAIALNPKYATAYYNRGNTKYKLGNKQAALTDLDRAIILDPKYVKAYFNRGTVKSALGNKQGAILDYDRAITIDSKYTKAYSRRGMTKFLLGNKQEALTDFGRVIAIDPNDAEAYYFRSTVKLSLGDKQGAISDLSKSAELFRQQGRMDLYQQAMETIAKLKGN